MSDILHYYLDLLRGENNDNYGFHNILNTMKLSRHDKVFGECFDGIDLKKEPLVDIHFSDDGENASSFRSCKVSKNCFLSGHSANIKSMEFIDDNRLYSRSANEAITWDLQSGNPIKVEHFDNKKEKYDFQYYYDKWRMEYCKKEKQIKESLDPFIEISKYKINTSSSDKRLVSFSNNHGDYIMDLKNGKIIGYSVIPGVIEKVGKYYIYFDGRKIEKDIIVYDSEIESSKSCLNRISPFEMQLSKINNTNYLLVKESTSLFNSHVLEKILIYDPMLSQKSYIIDVENLKIVRDFNEEILATIYIPELDCLLIYYGMNNIELYSIKDFNLMVKFENINIAIWESTAFAVSNNKLFIALSNGDFGIDLFSIKTGKHLKSYGGYTNLFWGIISYDRTKMLCLPDISYKHTCLLWNLVDNRIIDKINIGYSHLHLFSPDGKNLLLENELDASTNSFDTKTGSRNFIIRSSDKFYKINNSKYYNHLPYFYVFNNILWSYSGKFFFLPIYRENEVLIYDDNGMYHGHINVTDPSNLSDICISNNAAYIAYVEYDYYWIKILNRETNQKKIIEQECVCLLNVSDDGSYMTLVSDVDFNKAIIKKAMLDVHEKIIISEEIIENDYVLLNYLKQFYKEQVDKNEYRSDGWTITVPSSPDNSTYVTAYLVPNLYIKNCDFRGSIFDDETKEIIRQYNGIV